MTRLPTELERLIFEYAAVNRPRIPTLMLVAHRVHVWPPRVRGPPLPPIFKPIFYEIRHTVHRCQGITSLSLTGDITGPYLLPALAQMQSLKRLSIEMKLLFADSQHLDLIEEVYNEEEDEPEQLLWLIDPQAPAKMPSLAYLTFNTKLHSSFLRAVLQRFKQLRVPVVGFTATDEESAVGFPDSEVTEEGAAVFSAGDEGMGVGMERLVVATYENPYQDWESGVRGGVDVWARAEEFARRKRGGEVDAGDYYMAVKKRQS
ncbi:tyrosinase central domain-containing protein [Favolaschia claudopus]|uniref:Tyrosinase central domain-containing protein n=1 Tax=Favolaschia claudopus TaxID=2862362 RepID=A0AAW0D8Z9_9AGAR